MANDAAIVADLKKIQGIASKPGVQFMPGKAYLGSSIMLQPGGGYAYPIDVYVREINIHENIYKEGILGYLEMVDSWNLIRNGIILGQELLYLKFCTAGAEVAGIERQWSVDFSKLPLQVYKVTDLTDNPNPDATSSTNTLFYRLHFCSPELLKNDRIRISQTMQGTVKDVVSNTLKTHLKTTKNLEIEETSDLKKYVVPNLHPFDFIKRLKSVAQKEVPKVATNPHKDVPSQPTLFKGRLTDFQFWETTRGYKFLPVIRPEEDSQLTLAVSDPVLGNYHLQMMTVLKHTYIKHGDTFGSIKEGAWGSKQINHNAYTKSVKTYQSNYLRSLAENRYSHVSKTPVYDDKERRKISDWPDSKLNLHSFTGTAKHTNILKTPAKTGENFNTPWVPMPAEASMQREMQTRHTLNYDQLAITVNGMSILETGMIVRLDLPDIGEGSGAIDKRAPGWENRLDNIWIITSLKHIIGLPENNYRCELVLSNTMAHTAKELPVYEAPGGRPYQGLVGGPR